MTNILAAGRTMEQTITSMMLLAQLTAHDKLVEPVSLQAVVEKALEQARPQIAERGVRVVCKDLPDVLGHEGWLYEVISNLIGNAIKYIGASNPQPELIIRAQIEGDQARIEFEDNGMGIADHAQSLVFEAFTRFSEKDAAGFGLGLSIARRIIERLGGTIGVKSQPGRGSTFWFRLPLARTEAEHDQQHHTI